MGACTSGGKSGGANSATEWKKQLKAFAEKGRMPKAIYGDRQQQKEVLEEIDKLYPMPSADGAKIIDRGHEVYVMHKGKVKVSSYPSQNNASQAEKNGALKKLLWNW